MYISNKMEYFSYKVDVACMGVHVSRHLKEELLGLQINGFGLFVI